MIPESVVNAWRTEAPWQTLAQVEQDLIIARALVDLYHHPIIAATLAFRGGTALNKLFIQPPARYSEDIDVVQLNREPIGPTLDCIREVLDPWLGTPRRKLTQLGAKLLYRYQTIDRLPARLKVEINTTEHLQVLPLQYIPLSVKTDWFTGSARIVSFDINELMASKLRALYQRRKGRDLFDMWYVVEHNLIDIDAMIGVFAEYCRLEGLPTLGEAFLQNLEEKKLHRDFRADMQILLSAKHNWYFNDAYQQVLDQVISKLP